MLCTSSELYEKNFNIKKNIILLREIVRKISALHLCQFDLFSVLWQPFQMLSVICLMCCKRQILHIQSGQFIA
jgi:hypothetical protein